MAPIGSAHYCTCGLERAVSVVDAAAIAGENRAPSWPLLHVHQGYYDGLHVSQVHQTNRHTRRW